MYLFSLQYTTSDNIIILKLCESWQKPTHGCSVWNENNGVPQLILVQTGEFHSTEKSDLYWDKANG